MNKPGITGLTLGRDGAQVREPRLLDAARIERGDELAGVWRLLVSLLGLGIREGHEMKERERLAATVRVVLRTRLGGPNRGDEPGNGVHDLVQLPTPHRVLRDLPDHARAAGLARYSSIRARAPSISSGVMAANFSG